MATIWISEHLGFAANNEGALALPPLAVQSASLSASASTLSLGSGTNLIGVQSDVQAWLLAGSSDSTGVATSTNAMRVPPNTAPIPFAVAPNSRVTVLST